MKISIDREELKAIVCAAIAAKFPGKWEIVSSDYEISRHLELQQVTAATIAEKAEEARIRAEWEAKAEADELAKKADLTETEIRG